MQKEIRFLLQQVMRLQLAAPLPFPTVHTDEKPGSYMMDSVVVLQSFNGEDSISSQDQNVLKDASNKH
jgi:hypothetical protein